MNTDQLFMVKEALHLLAQQAHLDSSSDFDTIAQLERDFTIAYYEAIGA